MTPRIIGLDQRYAASASLVRHGVEIITVRDERGGRFDLATRSLFRLIQRDGPGVWDHLAGAAKALRSHLVTDPMPIERNAQLTAAAGEVGRQARQLFGAVDEDALLREIADAAAALCTRDPLVGTVLRESLLEHIRRTLSRSGCDHRPVVFVWNQSYRYMYSTCTCTGTCTN